MRTTIFSRVVRHAAAHSRRRAPQRSIPYHTPAAQQQRGQQSSEMFLKSCAGLKVVAGVTGVLVSIDMLQPQFSYSDAAADNTMFDTLQPQSLYSDAAADNTSNWIANSDQMYETGNYKQTLKMLEDVPESDRTFEWSWRKARTLYGEATSNNMKAAEFTVKKNEMIIAAFDLIKDAHEENDQCNDVLRWYGILLNASSELIGTREKIKNLIIVKEFWEKAVELSKKQDATSMHLLGRWEKGLVEISWSTRQIAWAIFGTIPEASYLDAKKYFEAAENVRKNFWLNNKLQLAECCLKLNEDEEAKQHLLDAMEIPVITDEDRESKKEVEVLLKKHHWYHVYEEMQKK